MTSIHERKAQGGEPSERVETGGVTHSNGRSARVEEEINALAMLGKIRGLRLRWRKGKETEEINFVNTKRGHSGVGFMCQSAVCLAGTREPRRFWNRGVTPLQRGLLAAYCTPSLSSVCPLQSRPNSETFIPSICKTDFI